MDFDKLRAKGLIEEAPPNAEAPGAVPPPVPTAASTRYPGYGMAAFLALLGIPYLVGWREGVFLLSMADLWIHEVGHILFSFLGQFITVAGGTLLQLAIPIAAILSFWMTGQRLSSYFGLFWLGENLLNVSRYVADARAKQLPLVNFGGEVGPEGHDWGYLLGALGLLRLDTFLGGLIWLVGALLMLAAMVLAAVGLETLQSQWRRRWPPVASWLSSHLFDPPDGGRPRR